MQTTTGDLHRFLFPADSCDAVVGTQRPFCFPHMFGFTVVTITIWREQKKSETPFQVIVSVVGLSAAFELDMDVTEWYVGSLALLIATTTEQPPTLHARTRTVLPLTRYPCARRERQLCRDRDHGTYFLWEPRSGTDLPTTFHCKPPRARSTLQPHSSIWYVRHSAATWTWTVPTQWLEHRLAGTRAFLRSGCALGSWHTLLSKIQDGRFVVGFHWEWNTKVLATRTAKYLSSARFPGDSDGSAHAAVFDCCTSPDGSKKIIVPARPTQHLTSSSLHDESARVDGHPDTSFVMSSTQSPD